MMLEIERTYKFMESLFAIAEEVEKNELTINDMKRVIAVAVEEESYDSLGLTVAMVSAAIQTLIKQIREDS